MFTICTRCTVKIISNYFIMNNNVNTSAKNYIYLSRKEEMVASDIGFVEKVDNHCCTVFSIEPCFLKHLICSINIWHIISFFQFTRSRGQMPDVSFMNYTATKTH
jgi:hypothetical protein